MSFFSLNFYFILRITGHICYGYVHHIVDTQDLSACYYRLYLHLWYGHKACKPSGVSVRLISSFLHTAHPQSKARLSKLSSCYILGHAVKNTPLSSKPNTVHLYWNTTITDCQCSMMSATVDTKISSPSCHLRWKPWASTWMHNLHRVQIRKNASAKGYYFCPIILLLFML